MEEYQFTVRTALMPLYYKDFHCIMGACQDSCCRCWKIEFDKKDYLKVKRALGSPELEERVARGVARLRNSGGKYYARFKLEKDGECPFHREDGLCALQLECGEETLPAVCQQFPRQKADTTAGREYSLSLACEGVLAQLWDLPQGVDFWEEPLPEKEWTSYSVVNPVAVRFPEIRSLCIDVLQERSLPLSRRFLLLGVLLQQLQKTDWETGAGVDGWLARGETSLHDRALAGELAGLPGNRPMFLSHNHGVATNLMVLGSRWQRKLAFQLCESIKTTLPGKEKRTILDAARYQELEDRLLKAFPELDEYFFENLMVSVAFRVQFPYVSSPADLWRGYVNLCSLYSLYRFAAVCGSAEAVSREQLFHMLVNISRAFLHNLDRQEKLREELLRNDSADLAHMAILVGG